MTYLLLKGFFEFLIFTLFLSGLCADENLKLLSVLADSAKKF